MKLISLKSKSGRRRQAASSLVEVVVAIAISTMSISATVTGYVLASNRAEWSAYNLAAQSLAIQRMEQTRAASWDPSGYPVTDELVQANFPVVVEVLDVPIAGNNIVYATNTTTISTISANPPLRMIQVECVWSFTNRGLFTNTIATYRAPDQ